MFQPNWDKRQRTKQFCKQLCYWEYKKKTGYGSNLVSLNNARKNANSPEAKSKEKITKIANGSWLPDDIIVNGMTKKQYRRKVYRITKNKKEQLLDNWDGIDYYDGQYIKDNFKMHYLDGDYPSIDHIIGLHEGFKRGISPLDLCVDDNLVWTKRRINSSKRQYNKTGLNDNVKNDKKGS